MVLIGLMKAGKLEHTAIVSDAELPKFTACGWIVVGRDPTGEDPSPPPPKK